MTQSAEVEVVVTPIELTLTPAAAFADLVAQPVEIALAPVEVALEVAEAGVPGPPGPQGIPGVAGGRFLHVQDTPAAEWVIVHQLGRRVTPTLTLDEDPSEPVWTDVTFVDDNTITVTWPTPVAGRAEI